jgi:hypothetical protein
VSHARRQKSDTGELFAAHHLLRSFPHLAIEVVSNFLEPSRHGVHRHGELAHFVARVELNAMIELPGRHLARAFHERRQWARDPLAE